MGGRGKAYDEPGTSVFRRRRLDTPAVGRHDVADDRQAQTAASDIPGTRLVQPHEPFEDTFPVGLGYPGSVVLHDQLDTGVDLLDGDLNPGARVARGILNEVPRHLVKPTSVPADPSGLDPGGVDGESGAAYPPCSRQGHVVEIDVMLGPLEGSLVRLGEQQQLFHEPLHAGALFENCFGELALGQ